MKFISGAFTDLSYPTGANIKQAIAFINEAVPHVQSVIDEIKKTKEVKSINLWCRGSSGAMLAAIIASKMTEINFYIIHIKKEGENSHTSNSDYRKTIMEFGINMIIDDFIKTGETINHIKRGMDPYKIYDVDILLVNEASFADLDDISFKPKYFISSQYTCNRWEKQFNGSYINRFPWEK